MQFVETLCSCIPDTGAWVSKAVCDGYHQCCILVKSILDFSLCVCVCEEAMLFRTVSYAHTYLNSKLGICLIQSQYIQNQLESFLSSCSSVFSITALVR